MEALTNIAAMLSEKSIVVPNYQCAYSRETDLTPKNQKQVNTLRTDLQDYVDSKSSSPYDEEFYNRYLESLGNYLLQSAPHNTSLSNSRFQIKRESYTHLQQQLEVQRMTEHDLLWNKEKIQQRHSKLVDFFNANSLGMTL